MGQCNTGILLLTLAFLVIPDLPFYVSPTPTPTYTITATSLPTYSTFRIPRNLGLKLQIQDLQKHLLEQLQHRDKRKNAPQHTQPNKACT